MCVCMHVCIYKQTVSKQCKESHSCFHICICMYVYEYVRMYVYMSFFGAQLNSSCTHIYIHTYKYVSPGCLQYLLVYLTAVCRASEKRHCGDVQLPCSLWPPAVCMCVCMCVCIYVYVCICDDVQSVASSCMYVCVCVCMYTFNSRVVCGLQLYVCVCVCMYVCIRSTPV
jgi:hypothetical protein